MVSSLLEAIAAEGARAARWGLPREANPYVGPAGRAAWFEGFDEHADEPTFDVPLLLWIAGVAAMFAVLRFV